ncbi:hypothetical protein B5G28_12905 [Faecalibacterium sp. An77]|uniref:hypothetical protein n=1 Tax=Faecalibacterium sp. An77 TaxID=1965655 RepID=UPI000B36D10A|nr:hypothetical protein [Faecalibacterium sp. An77]OUN34065.1 hypothetical protein B5G28_12905 [Faecalibacterium sp. An77]
MMEGIYYKEWSTALGRDMEFKVYGTAGVPVLAFPCEGGRFYDWENNAMPDAAAWLIQNGRIQLFCADSIDAEGLLNGSLSPRRRAEMQEKYFCYITGELVPRVLALNAAGSAAKAASAAEADKPAEKPAAPKPVLWVTGADLGAYQAVNCLLRRPELFCGAIGLSGRYDVAGRMGGAEDDLALRNSPLAALAVGLLDSADKAALQGRQILLYAGQAQDGREPEALASTLALDEALKAAGIPVSTEIWGQDVTHEWHWWARAFDVFTNRLFS